MDYVLSQEKTKRIFDGVGIRFNDNDATIENKVGYLMQQVTHIKTVIGTAVDRIEYVDASLINKSKELETKIDNIDTSLKTIIACHIVGNYDLTDNVCQHGRYFL